LKPPLQWHWIQISRNTYTVHTHQRHCSLVTALLQTCVHFQLTLLLLTIKLKTTWNWRQKSLNQRFWHIRQVTSRSYVCNSQVAYRFSHKFLLLVKLGTWEIMVCHIDGWLVFFPLAEELVYYFYVQISCILNKQLTLLTLRHVKHIIYRL